MQGLFSFKCVTFSSKNVKLVSLQNRINNAVSDLRQVLNLGRKDRCKYRYSDDALMNQGSLGILIEITPLWALQLAEPITLQEYCCRERSTHQARCLCVSWQKRVNIFNPVKGGSVLRAVMIEHSN